MKCITFFSSIMNSLLLSTNTDYIKHSMFITTVIHLKYVTYLILLNYVIGLETDLE